MPALVIAGLQWGDEGKAKVLDALAEDADIIVRFQGGANAGHTVIVGEEKYAFHLIPAGIVRYGKVCVIANGVVVDPGQLVYEIDKLAGRGIDFANRFLISDRAHLVMPYHRVIEALSENGSRSLGTTRRGIGPCYSDKMGRVGLRVGDLYVEDHFADRLHQRVSELNEQLEKLHEPERVRAALADVGDAVGYPIGTDRLDEEAIRTHYLKLAERLKPYVCDTILYLNQSLNDGKRVLFEGAQASMLDVDFGTYPYVTSSNSTVCGVSSGTGVGPTRISEALGILKAYTTRVGAGPFPTELHDDIGDQLRNEGQEFGTTTGRPRRCGWVDLVQARFACTINAVSGLAITKLDVLSGLETVCLGVGYEVDGKRLESFPADLQTLSRCKPIYEEMPGWTESLTGCRDRSDLPANARAYLDSVEQFLGVPLRVVSVGGNRDDTIYCGGERV